MELKFPVISVAFCSDRDSKMGHSIFLTIMKKKNIISNIIGNIILSSSISGSKPFRVFVTHFRTLTFPKKPMLKALFVLIIFKFLS